MFEELDLKIDSALPDSPDVALTLVPGCLTTSECHTHVIFKTKCVTR